MAYQIPEVHVHLDFDSIPPMKIAILSLSCMLSNIVITAWNSDVLVIEAKFPPNSVLQYVSASLKLSWVFTRW